MPSRMACSPQYAGMYSENVPSAGNQLLSLSSEGRVLFHIQRQGAVIIKFQIFIFCPQRVAIQRLVRAEKVFTVIEG